MADNKEFSVFHGTGKKNNLLKMDGPNVFKSSKNNILGDMINFKSKEISIPKTKDEVKISGYDILGSKTKHEKKPINVNYLVNGNSKPSPSIRSHNIPGGHIKQKPMNVNYLVNGNSKPKPNSMNYDIMGSSKSTILNSKKGVVDPKFLMDGPNAKSYTIVGDKITPQQKKVLKSGNLTEMFGDWDQDGVINAMDCKPMDPKQHGFFTKAANLVRGRGFKENSTLVREGSESNIQKLEKQRRKEIMKAKESTQTMNRMTNPDTTAGARAYQQNPETPQAQKFVKKLIDVDAKLKTTENQIGDIQKKIELNQQYNAAATYMPKGYDKSTAQEIASGIKTGVDKLHESGDFVSAKAEGLSKNVNKAIETGYDKVAQGLSSTYEAAKKGITKTQEGISKVEYSAPAVAIKEGVKSAVGKLGEVIYDRGIKRELIRRGYGDSTTPGLDKDGKPIKQGVNLARNLWRNVGYFGASDEKLQSMKGQDANKKFAAAYAQIGSMSPEYLKQIGVLRDKAIVKMVDTPVTDNQGNPVYDTTKDGSKIVKMHKVPVTIEPGMTDFNSMTDRQKLLILAKSKEMARQRPVQLSQETASYQYSQYQQMLSNANMADLTARMGPPRGSPTQEALMALKARSDAYAPGGLGAVMITGKRFPSEYVNQESPSDAATLSVMKDQLNIQPGSQNLGANAVRDFMIGTRVDDTLLPPVQPEVKPVSRVPLNTKPAPKFEVKKDWTAYNRYRASLKKKRK